MKTSTLGIGAAAAVALGLGAYALSGGDAPRAIDAAHAQSQTETADAASGSESESGSAPTDAAATALTDRGYALGDVVLGNPDAPVTIMEYASLTCPHCASFHENVLPDVKAQLIDTGKANLVVREVYFDAQGLWAALTARCGGPARYHAYLDLIFADQDRLRARQEDVTVFLREVGKQGGLTQAQVDACLQDREFAESLWKTFQQQSAEDQVRSTPTIFINGELYEGPRTPEAIGAKVDELTPNNG